MSKEQKLLSKRRLDAKTHSVSHTETLITTGHENGITQGGGPKEKRVVALNSPESHSNYKHLPDSPELKEGAGKEVLVSPRVKHAAVMRHGELRKGEITQTTAHAKRDKRELSLAYKKELPIPHNLANYDSLVALLDVLEPFCESISEYGRGCKPQGGCCLGYTLTPSSVSDAVGALNRLKRLRTQVSHSHSISLFLARGRLCNITGAAPMSCIPCIHHVYIMYIIYGYIYTYIYVLTVSDGAGNKQTPGYAALFVH